MSIAEKSDRCPFFFSSSSCREQADGKVPDLVIGSDTVVVLNNEILEKPRDHAHAVQMLTKLSGRQHDVFTGLFVCCCCYSILTEDKSPS